MADNTLKTILEIVPSKDIPRVLDAYEKEVDEATKKAGNKASNNTKKATDEQVKSWRKLGKASEKTTETIKKSTEQQAISWDRVKVAFGAVSALIIGSRIAKKIAGITTESIKLASEAEGVERAFNRLANGAGATVLDDLKKSTQGTVSELELMKNAVQAKNFDIPLTSLGKLFAFAKQRADETGQSVDYLTESVVLGIGRKSPLILDNLGISAVRLRKELRGVGVESASVGEIAEIVGKIASESMANVGNNAETAKVKYERFVATIDNLKKTFGEAFLQPRALQGLDAIEQSIDRIINMLKDESSFISNFISDVVVGWGKYAEILADVLDKLTQIFKKEEDRYVEQRKNQLSVISDQLRLLDAVKNKTNEEIALVGKLRSEYTQLQSEIAKYQKGQEAITKRRAVSEKSSFNQLKKSELSKSADDETKKTNTIPLYGADISKSAFALQGGDVYSRFGEIDLLGGRKSTFDNIKDIGFKLDDKQFMTLHEGSVLIDESLIEMRKSIDDTAKEIKEQREQQVAILNSISTGLNSIATTVGVFRDPQASNLTKGASAFGTLGAIASLIPGGQLIGAGLGVTASALTVAEALTKPSAEELARRNKSAVSDSADKASQTITRGSAYRDLNITNVLNINSQYLDNSDGFVQNEIAPKLNELMTQATLSRVG